MTFENVTLERGVAGPSNSGGAIQAIGVGSLTIRDSVITDNSAQFGGGIYSGSGDILIERSEISSNTSIMGRGGGLSAFNQSVTIIDSTFTGNHTTHPTDPATGAALHQDGGTLEVVRSTFNDNTADEDGSGAAMYLTGELTATLTNSTVSGNLAYQKGGGIMAVGASSVSLEHVTVAQNVGVNGGAGLYANGGAFTLTNTLVHNNQATAGDSNCEVASGSITSSGGNLSDDATCTSLTDATDLNDNAGTTLDALADNGGFTETHALAVGSTAVDGADCIGGVTDDQRSLSRPQSTRCDIGAFELEAASVGTSTTTTTTTTTTSSTTSTTTSGGGSGGGGAGSGGGTPTTDTGPTDSLPPTGPGDTNELVAVAIVLLALGGAALVVTRRRTVV